MWRGSSSRKAKRELKRVETDAVTGEAAADVFRAEATAGLFSVYLGCAEPQEHIWDGHSLGASDVATGLGGQLCLKQAGVSHCFPKRTALKAMHWSSRSFCKYPLHTPMLPCFQPQCKSMPHQWTKIKFHLPAPSAVVPATRITQGCYRGMMGAHAPM